MVKFNVAAFNMLKIFIYNRKIHINYTIFNKTATKFWKNIFYQICTLQAKTFHEMEVHLIVSLMIGFSIRLLQNGKLT